MLKKIVEMQNVSRQVQRINTSSLVKVMVVSWIALLVQIKFNKSARKTVIRMLYIFGGMITVLGVMGTTGILGYKYWKKRKSSQVF